jgi:hypothetical protein
MTSADSGTAEVAFVFMSIGPHVGGNDWVHYQASTASDLGEAATAIPIYLNKVNHSLADRFDGCSDRVARGQLSKLVQLSESLLSLNRRVFRRRCPCKMRNARLSRPLSKTYNSCCRRLGFES